MNVISSVSRWFNFNTDASFSWGCFIFWGHQTPIRSDNTSNVVHINPKPGCCSPASFSLWHKRESKHLASQTLGADRVMDLVLTTGEVDSSQSYQEVQPWNMSTSLSHQREVCVCESGFVFWCDSRVFVVLHPTQKVISSGKLCEECDACWSTSEYSMAYFSVL